MAHFDYWWAESEQPIWERLLSQLRAIDQAQVDIFERMLRNRALYDPNDRASYQYGTYTGKNPWSEYPVSGKNVVAMDVDTIMAIVAAQEPRARFLTEDGEWSQVRKAKALEAYAEGLVKKFGIHEKIAEAFENASVEMIGSIKVTPNKEKRTIDIEVTPPLEVVVDDGETGGRPPRTRYHRKIVSKECLKAIYPDKAFEIDRAQARSHGGTPWAYWADIYPLERDQVVVAEAWRLPNEDGSSGLHAIVVDGADLFVEPWTKDRFPCADIRWSRRSSSFYGISLVERVSDAQRRLNKLYYQRDRCIDQFAFPTTWYHRQDAEMAVKGYNKAGMIGTYTVAEPKTVIPPAVSPDIVAAIEAEERTVLEQIGVNRMTAGGMIPPGLESGEAVREYHAKTSGQRFSMQEKALSQFFVDVLCLCIEAAKELGDDAPIVIQKRTKGKRKLKWSDVDMEDVWYQITTSSGLPKTAAGQLATAMDMLDRGLMTPDEYRSMVNHPDLQRVLSIYTAAERSTERCIEEILDGEILTPEPFQNLEMITVLGQAAYNDAVSDGCPEDILENLRSWIVQAADTLNPMPPPQPALPPPMAPPGMPPVAPPVMPPPVPQPLVQ